MALPIKRILVIGATGFVGQRVVRYLSKHHEDVEIVCMVREGSLPPTPPEKGHLTIVRGNLNNKTTLLRALSGKDALIYAASLGFGHAQDVVDACVESGVKRAVFCSTTAIFTKLNAPSKKVRMAAENTIQTSGLDWTIIRPTMIYGRKGDRNMERLVKYLQKLPVLFVPGGGKAMQQPVFVDDVAYSLVASCFEEKTIRKAYNVSGKEPLSFKDIVQKTAKALGKKGRVLPLPFMPLFGVLKIYEKIIPNPRLKAEQLERLQEDKVFSHMEAAEDFSFKPRTFEDGIRILVNELK